MLFESPENCAEPIHSARRPATAKSVCLITIEAKATLKIRQCTLVAREIIDVEPEQLCFVLVSRCSDRQARLLKCMITVQSGPPPNTIRALKVVS